MNKLTAEKCRYHIDRLQGYVREGYCLSLIELDTLKSFEIALPVLEPKVWCQWKYDESDHYWSSECGEDWQFTDGGPEENRVKFCQGCGKPVILFQPPTPQIDNDDWIEWGGGERPVEPHVWVEIRYRAAGEYGDYARHFLWFHDGANDDIIAYRVIENDGREG